MDYKKILEGVLSKTLNIDDGKIAELFKDGENELSETAIISNVLNLDVDRVKAIRDKNGIEKFQEGFKKAKKETLAELESELKEKFNVESSKMGIDLIDEIVQKSGTPVSDLTEEAIRKSKIYLDLEANAKKEKKQLTEEAQKQIQDIKSTYEGEKIFSSVNKKAIKLLQELNPVLPTNKTIADNQINAFLNNFKDFDFELQEDRIVVLNKDKTIVADEHGNTRNFDEIVKEKASNFFEFQQNNGGSGSGNGGSGSGGYGGSGFKKPTSLEELSNILNDDTIDGKEKLKIAEEYEQKGS